MATYTRPHRIHMPNWRVYLTRRVLIVTGLSVLGYTLDYTLHMHFAGKGGELLIGAVLGHCLLEIEA